MEVRAALKDQMLNRLELRLGDPMDSEFDRKVAANVPPACPAAASSRRSCTSWRALPRIDAGSDADGPLRRHRGLRRARSAAAGRAARPRGSGCCRASCRADAASQGLRAAPDTGIAIGIDETNLEPVFVDFETDPFFLVFGESESGKTALLRLHRQADHRAVHARTRPRSWSATTGAPCSERVPDDSPARVRAHCRDAAAATWTRCDGLMERRAPEADITPQQLRDRSWWTGPQLFVIIDDYDLVATQQRQPAGACSPRTCPSPATSACASSSPAAPPAPPAPSYEPFMQRIKELGAQGVVLSGDPGEGDLLGSVRPRPMPPGPRPLRLPQARHPLVQLGWLPEQ